MKKIKVTAPIIPATTKIPNALATSASNSKISRSDEFTISIPATPYPIESQNGGKVETEQPSNPILETIVPDSVKDLAETKRIEKQHNQLKLGSAIARQSMPTASLPQEQINLQIEKNFKIPLEQEFSINRSSTPVIHNASTPTKEINNVFIIPPIAQQNVSDIVINETERPSNPILETIVPDSIQDLAATKAIKKQTNQSAPKPVLNSGVAIPPISATKKLASLSGLLKKFILLIKLPSPPLNPEKIVQVQTANQLTPSKRNTSDNKAIIFSTSKEKSSNLLLFNKSDCPAALSSPVDFLNDDFKYLFALPNQQELEKAFLGSKINIDSNKNIPNIAPNTRQDIGHEISDLFTSSGFSSLMSDFTIFVNTTTKLRDNTIKANNTFTEETQRQLLNNLFLGIGGNQAEIQKIINDFDSAKNTKNFKERSMLYIKIMDQVLITANARFQKNLKMLENRCLNLKAVKSASYIFRLTTWLKTQWYKLFSPQGKPTTPATSIEPVDFLKNLKNTFNCQYHQLSEKWEKCKQAKTAELQKSAIAANQTIVQEFIAVEQTRKKKTFQITPVPIKKIDPNIKSILSTKNNINKTHKEKTGMQRNEGDNKHRKRYTYFDLTQETAKQIIANTSKLEQRSNVSNPCASAISIPKAFHF